MTQKPKFTNIEEQYFMNIEGKRLNREYKNATKNAPIEIHFYGWNIVWNFPRSQKCPKTSLCSENLRKICPYFRQQGLWSTWNSKPLNKPLVVDKINRQTTQANINKRAHCLIRHCLNGCLENAPLGLSQHRDEIFDWICKNLEPAFWTIIDELIWTYK